MSLNLHRTACAAVALPLLVAFACASSGCGTREFLHVREKALEDGVRVVLGGGGNSLVLLHGPEALVVDPKFLGYARGLQKDVEERWRRRVRRVVLTHFHVDHVGGTGLFKEVGAVLAHPEARARLTAEERGPCGRVTTAGRQRSSIYRRTEAVPFHQGAAAPLPVCAWPFVEVREPMTLWLGGREVRLLPLHGHTAGDLAVFLPQEGILAAGDLVMKGWAPHLDPEGTGDFLQMAAALDRLLELPFKTLVPGHGELGGREDVELARSYLRALEEDVRAAIAQGLSEEAASARAVLREEHAHLRFIPGDSQRLNAKWMYRALVASGAGQKQPQVVRSRPES